MCALSEALKINTVLTTLSLKCGQQQCTPKQRRSMTINKTDNSFGEEGTRALSEALKTNSSLAALNLNGEHQSARMQNQTGHDTNCN